MLLALTSPVTPCHTLPARFLPFLLASSPLLPARPHQYSRQELSWVWLPLLAQLGCGEDVRQTSLLSDPGSSPQALPGTAGL